MERSELLTVIDFLVHVAPEQAGVQWIQEQALGAVLDYLDGLLPHLPRQLAIQARLEPASATWSAFERLTALLEAALEDRARALCFVPGQQCATTTEETMTPSAPKPEHWYPTASTAVEAQIQQAVAALTPTETVGVVTAARELTQALQEVLRTYAFEHRNTDPLVELLAVKDLLAALDADWRGAPENENRQHDHWR